MEAKVGASSSSKRPSSPLHFDRSEILEVKPLRCLIPVFRFENGPPESAPRLPPFICVPPSGPFPSGVTHFYPFASPKPRERTPPTPVALSGKPAVTTPVSAPVPFASFRSSDNGDVGVSSSPGGTDERKPRRKKKDPRSPHPDTGMDMVLDTAISALDLAALTDATRSDGDKKTVDLILAVYSSLRRRTYQLEEARDPALAGVRRSDLKPGVYMTSRSLRTNLLKRVGPVPGVEVGDVFFTRTEMCLVGLHSPSMAGIDYMTVKIDGRPVPLAVSIVSSGEYDDDSGDGSVLMYTGQGGNVISKEKEAVDQKLERGNLALESSMHEGNEVRVIRGLRDGSNPAAKVYVYDGVYTIRRSWVEKGKTGCNVFKYSLARAPGQPEAFTKWKNVERWRQDLGSRPGVILPDLTSGLERLPVCLVNDVDGERGPSYFTYSRTGSPVGPADGGCGCRGGCVPYERGCGCIRRNGGRLPYVAGGVTAAVSGGRAVIYECGPGCGCPAGCRNRVSQGGTRVRLEVFKTEGRGWGLRSWDPLRAGVFVCEYIGEVVGRSGGGEGEYVLDAGSEFGSVLSSERVGNVARFMNHSCSPNVLWQPVSRGGDRHFCFAFFAGRNVPPMAELTYDYGSALPDSRMKNRVCLCGAADCRGYF